MKKTVKIITLLLIVLCISMIECQAYTLDCSKKMKYGNQSDNVKALQESLNATEKCGLPITGYFGDMTLSCVKKYQSHHSLSPSGIVGKKTCKKLKKVTASGSIIKYNNVTSKRGIVSGTDINVRTAPSTNSKIIKRVKHGKIYTITDSTKKWYKIKINKTTEGYIYKDYFVKNFVLVDLSMQRLYYFRGGKKKWATDVVTGNIGAHETPVGTYNLNRNYFGYHTYLEGNNDDGSRYKAYVEYWMPFILSSGIGFHDASWRPSTDYTKDQYKGNGSHGCVNMQTDAAKKLYNGNYNNLTVIVRK